MNLTEAQARERFKQYAPLVQKYDSPISVATRLAQLFVESQIFTSELAKKSNNGFGIKASAPWTGDSIPHVSGEVGGARESRFRKYPSHEASIKDHAGFFTSTNFRASDTAYGLAIKATNYKDEAKNLGPKFPGDKSSYAGDPLYATKLINAIEKYNLTQYDKEKENNNMAKLTLEQAFAKLGLPFKKQLLPLTKTYGRINRKQGTVIHQTGAPQSGKDAQWMANYQKQMATPANGEEKSWNYQVDDKEAIMSFEHNVATWQSTDGRGPGNTAHISIESCINSDGNYAKGIDNLAKTMAVIAYVENFKSIESTTGRHYDFARDKKWCPAQILNGKEGFTYSKVKSMAQAHLNTLKGADSGSKYNPQGLETIKVPKYTAPAIPFDKLEVGQTVTIRDPFKWYDKEKDEFMVSKRHDEIVGTTDKIKEIKELTDEENTGYSRRAYLLENYFSWILEQDLVEARASWEAVKEIPQDVDDSNLKDAEPLPEGQFELEGVRYQVEKLA